MRDFRNLKVWGKAHKLTLEVYRLTLHIPKEEKYGLSSQLRRSAVSIGANIAEGYGRSGDAELARFLRIAQGSSSELMNLLLLARDLKYIEEGQFERVHELVVEVQKMLTAFVESVIGN